MLTDILFKVRLFDSPKDKYNSRTRLLWLLEALAQIDRVYLEIHPEIPPLYETGVVYRPEKGEIFRDVYHILEDGCGDCDCLSSWRVAELRIAGVNAHSYIKWRKEIDRWVYHALVWLPGGRIEDPSLALGMGGGKIVKRPIYVSP